MLLASRLMDYTLNLQGVSNEARCSYVTQTPITSSLLANMQPLCPAGQDVIVGRDLPIVFNNPREFATLPCGEGHRALNQSFKSYLLHIYGGRGYGSAIGNVTCTLLSQPAIFPVTFSQQSGSFSNQPATIKFTEFPFHHIQSLFQRLNLLEARMQTYEGNLIADSVITSGVKAGLQPNQTSDTYLQLFESMFEAMMDYYVGTAFHHWMMF